MTEYQKTADKIEHSKVLCEELLNSDKEDFRQLCDKYVELHTELESMSQIVKKYTMQLIEQDPEKRLYGPKMMTKIQDLTEKYEILYGVYQEELRPNFEPIIMEKRRHEERAKAEALQRREAELRDLIQRGREQTIEEERGREAKLETQEGERKAKAQAEAYVQGMRDFGEKRKADEWRHYQDLAARVASMRETPFKERLYGAICGLLKGALSSRCGSVPSNLTTTATQGDTTEAGLSDLQQASTEAEPLPLQIEDPLPALATFKAALDSVLEVPKQVISHPDVLSPRVLRINNAEFQANIATRSGAVFLLMVLGFKLVTGKELRDLLTTYYEEPYLYLEEPDASGEYRQWLNWLHNLQTASSVMEEISREAGEMLRAGRSTSDRSSLRRRQTIQDVEGAIRHHTQE